jgi:hypothetical protein
MEDKLIIDYRSRSLKPTLEEAISDLDLTTNYTYPNLRIYLVQEKICSVREFNRARHAAFVKAALGTFPTTAAELIDVVIENQSVVCANFGMKWVSPITNACEPCDQSKIVREAHRVNDTILGNAIRQANIERAVQYYFDSVRELDRDRRSKSLLGSAEFDWDTFGTTFFDESRVSRSIQIAVLKKFIWQVKRRLSGLPVTNHLMAVIYGSQGTGKTKAVEIMTEPLGSLVTSGDFQRLGDIREVQMFQSYVVVLDEMQRATQADVDRVKNVVTRDRFDYKPLYSNGNVNSVQNATFIGTSNRTLDQMIHDPTGLRRFFQIDWSNDVGPDQWAYLNGLNITDMWCSVDHLADDPTAPFITEIRAIQGSATYRNSVGQFFDAVVEGGGTCTVRDDGTVIARELSGLLRKEEFYHIYRGYCDYMRIRSPLEAEAFYKEVRRIADQEADCPFKPRKGRQFNGWSYCGSQTNSTTSSSVPIISLVKKVAA